MFNWVKTAMLMAAIMALFGVVGGMVGGRSGRLEFGRSVTISAVSR